MDPLPCACIVVVLALCRSEDVPHLSPSGLRLALEELMERIGERVVDGCWVRPLFSSSFHLTNTFSFNDTETLHVSNALIFTRFECCILSYHDTPIVVACSWTSRVLEHHMVLFPTQSSFRLPCLFIYSIAYRWKWSDRKQHFYWSRISYSFVHTTTEQSEELFFKSATQFGKYTTESTLSCSEHMASSRYYRMERISSTC